MNVPVLLAGIVIAALLFSALLWSVYRAVTTTGRLRLHAGALAFFTVLGMVSISLNAPGMAILTGAGCAGMGAMGIWSETRWSKLMPLVQLLFGLALIARLPWA